MQNNLPSSLFQPFHNYSVSQIHKKSYINVQLTTLD